MVDNEKRVEQEAKIRALWDEADGFIYDGANTAPGESVYCPGPIRLRIVPDECCDFDNLCGDTFDPRHNPEIPVERLEREREEFFAKAERDGIWGIVGEYWNGEEWVHADSVWGFVGDDWERSGYDVDVMAETLKQWRGQKHCPTCGRPRI